MSYAFPPPAEWQAFEAIVASIAKALFDPLSVHRYGRSGQQQHGVDVYARDYFGRAVGIQCKLTEGVLKQKAVIVEADNAMEFEPRLEYFIIWTTARRDNSTQDFVRSLNDESAYPFQVDVRFWDDASDQLNRMYDVAHDYYSAWLGERRLSADDDHKRKLAIAFARPAFSDPIHLERDFSALHAAVRDTLTFLRAGLLYDRYGHTLILQAVASNLLEDSTYSTQIEGLIGLLDRLELLLQSALADSNGAPILFSSTQAQEGDRLRRRIRSTVKAITR